MYVYVSNKQISKDHNSHSGTVKKPYLSVLRGLVVRKLQKDNFSNRTKMTWYILT